MLLNVRTVVLCLLSLGMAGLLAESTSLRAASPSVSVIMPRGAQRGTEATITFSGGNLSDTQEVLVYYPGITVSKFEVVNNNQVKATLKIAADCRLGEHGFRLRTATGISDFRTFWVGALPVVDEKEPNNSFETPQPIPLNVTVHGVVRSEQVDYYQVECKKGQRLSVEVEAQRLGHTFFDPYVAILDSKRFEIATSDDNPLLGQDSGCSVLIPNDGKYIVQVRETAFQGNDSCLYRLHIGTFPMPKAVFPAGGKPGEEVEFRFVGDPLGEIKQKIKLPAVADPLFRVHATTADGINPSGFKVRVADIPNAMDTPAAVEPKGAAVVPAP
ncbi:MAG: PPC domain-containing protein, partial [Gemmataceae bacterium]